ncbi:unnamed protein product [Symbiodinium sp. CCMP2592]|nr:unnamed protein product [Symbiodinium sp. CCMP2592]
MPPARAAPVLDPRKLGQAALLAWVRHNEEGIQSQQTKWILHQLWTLPRAQQARLLETSGICAHWKAGETFLLQDAPPLAFDPLAAEDEPLLPEGWVPLVMERHPSCCLSRELKRGVYSHDFKTTRPKPKKLQRFRARGVGQVMHAVIGKDDGHMYYSATPLESSPTAKAILNSGESINAQYARLPLLLTPSEAVPHAAAIQVRPEDEVHGHKIRDGQAEIGPELAANLGMLATARTDAATFVYDASQFRACLRLASGGFGLCKGMLFVNEALHGWDISMPSSCVKLKLFGSLKVQHGSPAQPGWDLVALTSGGLPRLNAQVLSIFFMRALLMPASERSDLMDCLKSWLGKLLELTVRTSRDIAWSLPRGAHPIPAGYTATPLFPPPAVCAGPHVNWEEWRTPQHMVQVEFAEQGVGPETSLDVLDQELAEERAWTLARGTRDALTIGGQRYAAHYQALQNEPRLNLQNFGCMVVAVSDMWGSLGPKQCHIVHRGTVWTGKFAVWRSPVMTPDDVQATFHEVWKLVVEAVRTNQNILWLSFRIVWLARKKGLGCQAPPGRGEVCPRQQHRLQSRCLRRWWATRMSRPFHR